MVLTAALAAAPFPVTTEQVVAACRREAETPAVPWLVPLVMLAAVLAWFVEVRARRRRSRLEASLPGVAPAAPAVGTGAGRGWGPGLEPALMAGLIFVVVMGALSVAGFYDRLVVPDDLAFLAGDPRQPVDAAAEMAARAIWGLTLAGILLSALAVCWVVAEAFVDAENEARWAVLPALAGLGLLFAVLQLAWRESGASPAAFGSAVSEASLCSLWWRTGRTFMGSLTDALNMVAVVVTLFVAAAFGVCRARACRWVDADAEPLPESG